MNQKEIYKNKLQNMYQTEYDYVFKILLIGNSAVGKSSLLMRFAEDIFSENFLPTIGVDFKIRTFEAAGSKVKLQMWDTAGQQKFKTITSAYYRGAQGILLVYDITDKKSFTDLQQWLEDAQKYSKENTVKILVGNKKDLQAEREVQMKEAQMFADSLGIHYFETSAKQSINIEEIFTNLVIDMKKIPKPTHIASKDIDNNKLPKRINKQNKNKQLTCC